MTDFQVRCKNLARALEDAADDWETLFLEEATTDYERKDHRAIRDQLKAAADHVMAFKRAKE